MNKIRIPVGEENFELLRKKKSYYVDKTGFIEELLNEDFKVSLITAPLWKDIKYGHARSIL